MRPAALLCLLTVAAAAAPSAASEGGEIPCGRVEAGVIRIDGILEDWADVPPLLLAGDGSQDFAVSVKCNYDDRFLYLVADVQDDKLRRDRHSKAAGRGAIDTTGKSTGKSTGSSRNGARGKTLAKPPRVNLKAHASSRHGSGKAPGFPAEDGIEVLFEESGCLVRLVVLPGDADHDIAHVVFWDPRRESKLEEADSLQPSGWAVELKIPLDEVPGWFAGAPDLHLALAAHDADPGQAHGKGPRLLATSPRIAGHLGSITFGEANEHLAAFLRDRNLNEKDLRFNQVGRGTGRVVLADKTLAFVSDEWAYVELPVASAADVLEVRLVDLAGNHQDSALVRYRERGPAASSREILCTYRVTSAGLSRVFGVEVGKSQGANRLVTRVSFPKRGEATDILVEAQPAVGWNSDTYRDAPALDVAPIPLPWSTDTRARFVFHGEQYQQSD